MLKTRIMPTLLFKDLGLVKGVKFDSWRRVGGLMQAIKVYSMRAVDELIFLDITATQEERSPDFELVDDFADECFMPLTVGGGVTTINDVKRLLEVGADKVAINTAAILNPGFISEAAGKFGSQCIVVSIDVKKVVSGKYEVFVHAGKKATGVCPIDFSKRAEELGAGEILITSIDQDGTMTGYDTELTKHISNMVSVPVIASGGAGNYQHMLDVITLGGASAIAAASIFHYTQQTPLEAKHYLKEHGIHVRL